MVENVHIPEALATESGTKPFLHFFDLKQKLQLLDLIIWAVNVANGTG